MGHRIRREQCGDWGLLSRNAGRVWCVRRQSEWGIARRFVMPSCQLFWRNTLTLSACTPGGVERGLTILSAMRGRVSGLGIPHYVVDPPGGEGKVPLLSENLIETGQSMTVRTSRGVVVLPNRTARDVV